MTLIRSIDDLRLSVKINKNTPFETVLPFIRSAENGYILPYIGQTLYNKLVADPQAHREAFDALRFAAGTLSMLLYTHEGSINIGDSGHTVQKSQTSAPASDAKIEAVVESFYRRGYQALDQALGLLKKDKAVEDELATSPWYQRRFANYIRDPELFEKVSGFQIGHSELFLDYLRPLMSATENVQVVEMISPELDKRLRISIDMADIQQPDLELIRLIRRFVAIGSLARLACQSDTRYTRFIPGILPFSSYDKLLNSITESCKTELTGYLIHHYPDNAGEPNSFNAPDKKIFFAG